MKNIVVLDNKAYIINRIKKLVADYDICVHETLNSMQFFGTLARLNYDVELIIMEVNLGDESGFDIIRKFKRKGIDIPVLILTSENRRKEFIKGIKAGAMDYILKPFDGQFLLKRIIKDIQRGESKKDIEESIQEVREHSLDFEEYISKELNGSNTEVSFAMITIFKSVKEYTSVLERKYMMLSKFMYPKLKEIFMESDFFKRYGYQSFIAAYKFINKENEEYVINKVNKLFETLKVEKDEFKEYYLACVFVNYPSDGKTKDELLNKARTKIVEEINKTKRVEN